MDDIINIIGFSWLQSIQPIYVSQSDIPKWKKNYWGNIDSIKQTKNKNKPIRSIIEICHSVFDVTDARCLCPVWWADTSVERTRPSASCQQCPYSIVRIQFPLVLYGNTVPDSRVLLIEDKFDTSMNSAVLFFLWILYNKSI